MALTKRLITINEGEKELSFFVNLVNGTVSLTSVYNNIFTGQRTRHILKSAGFSNGDIRERFAPLWDAESSNESFYSPADIFTRLNGFNQ